MSPIRSGWKRPAPWILGLVAALVFGLNLGFPLAEPDESRYAHVARQMLERGDWLVPRRGGEPFLDKPPLTYWTMAVSMAILGPDEGPARLPIALAGWLGVMLTWAMGRRIVGERASLFGAYALILSIGYVLASRYILTDLMLAVLVASATWAAYLAVGSATFGRRWWYLSATLCGLAVLTKGPIGLILPAMPVVATALLGAWQSRPRWHDWVGAWTVTVAISLWWFGLLFVYEPDFGPYFFYRQHIVRVTEAFDHQEPWWYYGPAIVLGMLPASALLPGLIVALVSRRPIGTAMRDAGTGYLTLAAASVVGLFSLSECKLPTYILPAVPSLALLMGTLVDRVILARAPRSVPAAATLPTPAFTDRTRHVASERPAVTTLDLPVYLRHLRRDVPVLAVIIGALCGVGLIGTMAVVSEGSILATTLTAIFVTFGVGLGVATLILPTPDGLSRAAFRWCGGTGTTVTLVGVTFTAVYPMAVDYRSYMHQAHELAADLDQAAARNRSASPPVVSPDGISPDSTSSRTADAVAWAVPSMLAHPDLVASSRAGDRLVRAADPLARGPVPVVFVGTLAHGAEFILAPAQTHQLPVERAEYLGDLAERYGQIIVVTPGKSLPTILPAIDEPVTWEQVGDRGFVHIVRPDPAVRPDHVSTTAPKAHTASRPDPTVQP